VKDLLSHYESELSRLRSSTREFAAQYPKIAGRLALGADMAEDPHVERLIQSFALLAARVHKRLDDDFPLVTESLLDVLYPHYLRPFPACAIAQVDIGDVAAQMTAPARVCRGTVLNSRAVRGVPCKFRTAYDVSVVPTSLRSVVYRRSVVAPLGTRLPPGGTSVLSLEFERLSSQVPWSSMGDTVRLYLNGEPSLVSLLREVLCDKLVGVMVEAEPGKAWMGPYSQRPTLVGFGEDEALIDYDDRSHPAYRLLTEYFAFPDKFNFLDVPLPVEKSLPPTAGKVTLHFVLEGLGVDSDQSRLLDTVSSANLVLRCTPVVNLFKQNADPIRISHTTTQYPVVVSAQRAYGYEVYSIDKVYRVRQSPAGEVIDEFQPFFSMRHEELLSADGVLAPGRYWHTHRDEAVAMLSPGYELQLSIVDANLSLTSPQTDTLSLQVTATNRSLPDLLTIGNVGGDLFMEGAGLGVQMRLLRKFTRSQSFERGNGSLWRLVSHLSLNHLSISGRGVEALREMLHLYDLPRDAANHQQIEGIIEVAFAPATAWLASEPFATFVRGTEVKLFVDEPSFVGSGIHVFAAVMDRFFGLYTHVNSFTQLTVISARTQKPILQCPPRNGATALV